MKQTFAIVGAGVAASSAADTLRANGFEGRIVLVGRENDLPYNRPALSKERLRGEVDDEGVVFHAADHYREQNIEVLLARTVTRVDVRNQEVQLESGTSFRFDKALIATGADVRRFASDKPLDGIYYLRSLADCRKLADTFHKRPRVLVLGTGFIGCEVAASARVVGCEVTLAGRKPPLAHVLGPEIGRVYSEYHRSNGIDVRSGVDVNRFEGGAGLERAMLSDGSSIDCDVAVIGIGVVPSLDVLRGQPVDIQDGILVDEFCRTTAPNVYAAGDAALFLSPRYRTRIRVEHFDNAQHQAAVAAKAMLGDTAPYDPIPSFWSDQFSYRLQYRGYARTWDRIALRGAPSEASFTAFYLTDGHVQAICSVNRYKENYAARKLIGKSVDVGLLEDDTVDIKTLAEQKV